MLKPINFSKGKENEKKDKIEEFAITIQSPYCLQPFDLREAITNTIMFEWQNYELCGQVVRIALNSTNKLGIID